MSGRRKPDVIEPERADLGLFAADFARHRQDAPAANLAGAAEIFATATSAQKDISDSIQQSQQNQPPNPEAAKAAADLQASQAKNAADIANHKALTDAKIQAMHAEAAAKREIALADAQHQP